MDTIIENFKNPRNKPDVKLVYDLQPKENPIELKFNLTPKKVDGVFQICGRICSNSDRDDMSLLRTTTMIDYDLFTSFLKDTSNKKDNNGYLILDKDKNEYITIGINPFAKLDIKETYRNDDKPYIFEEHYYYGAFRYLHAFGKVEDYNILQAHVNNYNKLENNEKNKTDLEKYFCDFLNSIGYFSIDDIITYIDKTETIFNNLEIYDNFKLYEPDILEKKPYFSNGGKKQTKRTRKTKNKTKKLNSKHKKTLLK